MAAPPPRSAHARLLREPRRFGFDAAVRILMRLAGTSDPAEAARFRSTPGLAYGPGDVVAVQEPAAGAPPQTTVAVMGLAGTGGVLPRLYTEALASSLRNRSHALHDFLDMLSHRIVAHFARAAVKYRLHRAAEETALDPRRPDPPAQALLALTGYGTPHLTPRLLAGTEPLLHYAGLFAARPRSAERLRALASDWLGRPVEVVEFAGSWLPLPPDQRTALPRGRAAGAWSTLGVDAAIGVRAWDPQARVVLRIGPLDRRSFEAMLPDQPGMHRFVSLVRAFLGFETAFAINLVLRGDEVPPARLDAGAQPPPRLGWNTWSAVPPALRARKARGDADEALFEAEIIEARMPVAGAMRP